MSTLQTMECEKSRPLDARPPASKTGGDKNKVGQVFSGIDWLGLTCYGANVTEFTRGELEVLKQRAENGSEEYITLGGVPWKVEGYGFGRGCSHMHYVLRFNGLTLAISNRAKSPAEGGGPVCMLTAPGQYCGGKDPLGLQKDLETVLEMCGFTLFRIGVNRLDLHTDAEGVSVGDVVGKMFGGKLVTRARSQEVVLKGKLSGEVETLYIGSRGGSDTFLCVYNKVAELAKDPCKAEVYKASFGLEEIPCVMTRYEWRLNGDALREQHNCTSLSEVMQRLQSIYSYLSCEWYRECVEVDKKNPHRSLMCPVWCEITDRAQKQFRPGAERCRREASIPDPVKLVAQVKGCLATICGVLGVLPNDASEAISYILPQMKSETNEWKLKVCKRGQGFRSMIAFSVGSFAERRAKFEAETLLLQGFIE